MSRLCMCGIPGVARKEGDPAECSSLSSHELAAKPPAQRTAAVAKRLHTQGSGLLPEGSWLMVVVVCVRLYPPSSLQEAKKAPQVVVVCIGMSSNCHSEINIFNCAAFSRHLLAVAAGSRCAFACERLLAAVCECWSAPPGLGTVDFVLGPYANPAVQRWHVCLR